MNRDSSRRGEVAGGPDPLPGRALRSNVPRAEKLRHPLAGQRNHRFGSSSESIEQPRRVLKTSEIAVAKRAARRRLPKAEPQEKPKRRQIPDHIPRMEAELTIGDDGCALCGGVLRHTGRGCDRRAGVCSGTLHREPHRAATLCMLGCEAFTQAQLGSRPIERGRPCPGLLAHVLVKNMPIICRSIAKAAPSSATGSALIVRRWPTG
ncbi:Transposase C of IS166 homeodomain-containing protein [Sedimentitalea nanhaiensis]|uniref:Transposase C of IS166 homeodomain-containing protein n=1 Tax=Sedimentitalea nanhaiensis TaxID=999627 RepID=A0A1I7C4K8_9RHOB|nr:Transposase C of IS166 homeodomain-containing protein [Sedimentitalea nanhaiensis]